jgi:indole-3-glycerol phosphate synthase
VEGVFKAQAISLPLPPSFNDGVRVARADRAVIVGLKRRVGVGSDIAYDVDFSALARRAEAAGACALAVWPEEEFFGGGYHDILALAQATSLPIWSRDPVIDPLQIVFARAHGAAAITIEVEFVNDDELRALIRQAAELGLDVVLEGRSAPDLERIANFKMGSSEASGARIVAVGASALNEALDYERLAALLPEFAASIASSGLDDGGKLGALEADGYDAFLVSDPLLSTNDFEETMGDFAGLPHG